MKNIQKDFEKKGYTIVKPEKKILNEIREIIYSSIKKKIDSKYKNKDIDNFFNKFHEFAKSKDLNEIRFSTYNLINKSKKFQNLYYQAAKPFLNILVGNELAMQKKINLSIQMPKDKDSLLDMHSDAYAGESPFQVVVWIPLVNVFSSKGMFFTTPQTSKKINNEVLNNDKYNVKQLYIKNKKKVLVCKSKFW